MRIRLPRPCSCDECQLAHAAMLRNCGLAVLAAICLLAQIARLLP